MAIDGLVRADGKDAIKGADLCGCKAHRDRARGEHVGLLELIHKLLDKGFDFIRKFSDWFCFFSKKRIVPKKELKRHGFPLSECQVPDFGDVQGSTSKWIEGRKR